MGLLRESSSRDKQKTLFVVSTAVLSVLIYLLLFPRSLGPEFTLVPDKAVALTETKADKLSPGGSFFTLGGWEGYWGPQGDVERAQQKRPHATATADRVAWWDQTKNQVTVESASGTVTTLPDEAYPLWVGNRLFTLDENRLGLKAWNIQGRLQWSKHFSSLITALDSTTNLTVVGTLDGKVRAFGPQGEESGGFQPGGSRLPVAYNVALSPDSRSILVLAGVDPKRFLVLERGGADFRPVYHKPLKDNHPWPTPLGFLSGGTVAYYENERGLSFVDPRNPDHEATVATQGTPETLESLPASKLVAFLQRDGAQSALRIASPTGASLMTFPFSAQDLLLQRQGNALILGVDQTLLRLEVKIQ